MASLLFHKWYRKIYFQEYLDGECSDNDSQSDTDSESQKFVIDEDHTHSQPDVDEIEKEKISETESTNTNANSNSNTAIVTNPINDAPSDVNGNKSETETQNGNSNHNLEDLEQKLSGSEVNDQKLKLNSKFPALKFFTPSGSENFSDLLFSKHTIHSTKYGVRLFMEWCLERGIQVDFDKITDEELDKVLATFFTSIRNRDGKRYSESTLINIKYSINRYLASLPEPSRKDIRGQQYETSLTALYKEIDEIRAIEKATRSDKKAATYISREDLLKLYESGVFDPNSPRSLLFKVWFEVCLHFCHKNREVQRQMTPDLFEFDVDESGKRFVYCNKMLLYKNEGQKNRNPDLKWFRMTEVKGHPMCPVLSLEKYLSKIKDFGGNSSCLFYRPLSKNNVGKPWYYPTPIGKNSLSGLMTTICKEANLSSVYSTLVLKTLPVHKWKEIIFESGNSADGTLTDLPINKAVSQNTIAVVQPQNLIPMNLINQTGIQPVVPQQQFTITPSLGVPGASLTLRGVGGFRSTPFRFEHLPTVTQMPINLTRAQADQTDSAVRPFASVISTNAASADLTHVSSVPCSDISAPLNLATAAPLTTCEPQPLPVSTKTEMTNIDASQAQKSVNSPAATSFQNVTFSSSANHGRVQQPKNVATDETDKHPSMTYEMAKVAVKKIYDSLDYWDLAKLVNWTKRIDVLKDVNGDVFCSDPLCKTKTTSQQAVKREDSSVEDANDTTTNVKEEKQATVPKETPDSKALKSVNVEKQESMKTVTSLTRKPASIFIQRCEKRGYISSLRNYDDQTIIQGPPLKRQCDERQLLHPELNKSNSSVRMIKNCPPAATKPTVGIAGKVAVSQPRNIHEARPPAVPLRVYKNISATDAKVSPKSALAARALSKLVPQKRCYAPKCPTNGTVVSKCANFAEGQLQTRHSSV